VKSPEDARIIEATTSVLGPSPFGPVTSGSLTLHARTIDLQYMLHSLPQTEVILQSPKRLSSAVADVVASARLRSYHEHMPHFGRGMLDHISIPDSLQDEDPSHLDGYSVPCTAVFIQNRLPTQVAESLYRLEEANANMHEYYTNWFMLAVKTNTEAATWTYWDCSHISTRIGGLYRHWIGRMDGKRTCHSLKNSQLAGLEQAILVIDLQLQQKIEQHISYWRIRDMLEVRERSHDKHGSYYSFGLLLPQALRFKVDRL
jgi:hypothetical protein